ncbi:MAG: GWxTD domain-containing protein [Bacteroidota bacterium]|nr:GWxTD domain-containing protein [Bacteroidota bacterium]
MRKYLSVIFVFFFITSFSQPLRDINYEYLYNPAAPVSLDLKPVRTAGSFELLFNFSVRDTVGLDQYSVQWEGRNLLSDKEGTPITLNDLLIARQPMGWTGSGSIPLEQAPKYIVGKVIHRGNRRAWIFYAPLEANYPVNNFLMRNGSRLTQPYIRTEDNVKLGLDSTTWMVSYYDDNFPAAAPAFSEAQARVSRVMAVDSVFRVRGNEEMRFPMKGLYLIQKDTTAVEGLAFRSEDDYPQFSKLANLAGPLIYITTRQEYDKLEAANGNKRAFDRVILGITTDTERARALMRSYFRRVELANRYFTSYKEGWKTDRGMIYIIFGVPEQVYRFDNREVWTYKNDQFDITFNFSGSSSLFDPDNFVLIREKKYEDSWYEVIDLWRNARF